jgi:SAM-dependent methyltransferase
MDWRIKAAVQKTLGALPGGPHLHTVLQMRMGVMKNADGELGKKLADWELLMGHLGAAGVRVAGASLFEVGTGWHPIIPVGLYLAGARRVVTIDVRENLQRSLTVAAFGYLRGQVARVAARAGCSEVDVARRLQEIERVYRSGGSLTSASSGAIRYIAPADGRATGLESESFDVTFTNSVLQHVPREDVMPLLKEMTRLLRPGGVSIHSITCNDHYAVLDGRINKLNYLRYSDADWVKWNTPFQHQNRLRARDFAERLRSLGLEILVDTSRVTGQQLAWLDTIPVHRDFAGYTREELAITTVDFVARKPV